MQLKNINRVLTRVQDNWLETIEDENLKALIRENSFVAGGAIASLFLGDKPNDYDVFFCKTSVAMAVANYYVSRATIPQQVTVEDMGERVFVKIKSAGIANDEGLVGYAYFENQTEQKLNEFIEDNFVDLMEELGDTKAPKVKKEKEEKKKYRPVIITSNAISLSDRIQIVMRFVGEPEHVINRFDYVHTKSYWTRSGGVVTNVETLACLLNKHLKYTGSPYPISAAFRMRKFMKRGWYIGAGDVLKMFVDAARLDLTNIATLEDQLIGVDTAYFYELVNLLKQKSPDGKSIDANYVMKLIDEVNL